MKVAVYCSASEMIRPEYFQDAEDLGTRLAVGGHELVYGGGNIGSMGKLASAAHRSGVKITSEKVRKQPGRENEKSTIDHMKSVRC